MTRVLDSAGLGVTLCSARAGATRVDLGCSSPVTHPQCAVPRATVAQGEQVFTCMLLLSFSTYAHLSVFTGCMFSFTVDQCIFDCLTWKKKSSISLFFYISTQSLATERTLLKQEDKIRQLFPVRLKLLGAESVLSVIAAARLELKF